MQIVQPLRRRSLGALALTLVLAVALGACGGSDSSSDATTSSTGDAPGGGSAEAVAAAALKIAEEHKDVTTISPKKPIAKSIPKDKTLIWVNCGQPSCVTQGAAFKAAGEVLGWNMEQIDITLPTPEETQAAFEEAIRRKPDGIASAGLGAALYSRQLAELNEMDVPVFENRGEANTGEDGITYDPTGPEASSVTMGYLANKTIADLGGKGEIGTVMLTGYPIVTAYTEGYEREIEAKCPECSVKRLEIQPTSIGKDAPEMIANFLRANPEIKALFISYDVIAEGLPAALQNVGIEEPLTYSWSLDSIGIERLQTGERTAAAIEPYYEQSWQLIDGFARLFVGESPVQPAPESAIWSDDFNNVPKQAEPFPALIPDYEAQFKKLWGVK